MNKKEKLLRDVCFDIQNKEFEGIVIRSKQSLADVPRGYRGLVVETNDHGNVMLWKAFKKGTFHEVVSRV